MKTICVLVSFLVWIIISVGCAGQTRHHDTSLPEPASFNAHFGDMDTDGDDGVNWKEFKSYFPQATPEVFQALDLNNDKHVDHDEWHEFKEAHGMRDHI